jgi:hypothetical protein
MLVAKLGNNFLSQRGVTLERKFSGPRIWENLFFQINGKASLALNVTKFFKASRPVYRASRPV